MPAERRDQQARHLVAERVRRRRKAPADREDRHAQHEADELRRIVREHAVQRVGCAGERVLQRPVHQREVRFLAAFFLEAL
jgi:hypothetical protein